MTENFNIQRIFEAIQEPLPEMLSNTIEELNKRLNNMAELFLEYYPLSQDTSGTALKNLKA
ncbi:MAG: hypothetical protein LBT92_00060, partial [Rickettsiales bacterium]|nr:hypothetical protein [Rickettsiales bacterium]